MYKRAERYLIDILMALMNYFFGINNMNTSFVIFFFFREGQILRPFTWKSPSSCIANSVCATTLIKRVPSPESRKASYTLLLMQTMHATHLKRLRPFNRTRNHRSIRSSYTPVRSRRSGSNDGALSMEKS